MGISKFEDIQAWQEARKLTVQIYRSTSKSPFSKDFGLSNQMQKAAVSVMANIAEGFGRESRKEFNRFLNIAYASVLEIQSHLYIAMDLGYITKDQHEEYKEQAILIAKLISGFQRYLKNSK